MGDRTHHPLGPNDDFLLDSFDIVALFCQLRVELPLGVLQFLHLSRKKHARVPMRGRSGGRLQHHTETNRSGLCNKMLVLMLMLASNALELPCLVVKLGSGRRQLRLARRIARYTTHTFCESPSCCRRSCIYARCISAISRRC